MGAALSIIADFFGTGLHLSALAVTQSLQRFAARALAQSDTGYFVGQHDPAWPSPCEIGHNDGFCQWRPVPQETPVSFAGIANALDYRIHEDIRAYYNSFWSGNFEAQSTEGPVSLIQLWNREDFDRLNGNLIGHMLMKQRAKQPFTVFFANTDPDSELFLSIDNESGRVLLEEPGRAPIKEVEIDVATFLDRLTPLDTKPVIY